MPLFRRNAPRRRRGRRLLVLGGLAAAVTAYRNRQVAKNENVTGR